MHHPPLTKVYYTIGEVAALFGLAPSVIRYWEAEFEVLKPSKNHRGERKYTQKDVKLLAEIHFLLKEKGYTIDGARKELSHRKVAMKDEKQLLLRLTSIKEKLAQIAKELETEN